MVVQSTLVVEGCHTSAIAGAANCLSRLCLYDASDSAEIRAEANRALGVFEAQLVFAITGSSLYSIVHEGAELAETNGLAPPGAKVEEEVEDLELPPWFDKLKSSLLDG